jgi:hypothetical protein
MKKYLSKISFIAREEGVGSLLNRARRAGTAKLRRLAMDKRENLARWEGIKNSFAGQRAFLIGNGPSLNATPLHLLRDEHTICFNRISLMFERWAWRPTFYATVDDRVGPDIADEINGVIVPETKYAFFPDIHPYNVDFREFVEPQDNVYWLYADLLEFSADLPYCGINKTVSNVGLQVLAFLGFTDIYLVGVDNDYQDHGTAEKLNSRDWTSTDDDDPNHFDPRYFGKERQYHRPLIEETTLKFQEARAFFEPRGVNIYNAGVGGKLEVFPRVDFRSLFPVDRGRELEMLVGHVQPDVRGTTLAETFPHATVEDDYRDVIKRRDTVGTVITDADLGARLIRHLVFTHLPLGPFEGRYLFIKRELN